MKSFSDENNINSGEHSFKILLTLIDNLNLLFINENYLNHKDYYYFFCTDKIEKKYDLLNLLEHKKSLELSFDTLKNNINNRLSIYFGIKNFIFEYGFINIDNNNIYKTGEFKCKSSDIHKFVKYNSFININRYIKNINIKNITKLHYIIPELYTIFNGIQPIIKILDENRISITYPLTIFKDSNININDTNLYINKWKFTKKWYNDFYSYSTIEDNNIIFYLKLKDS
jgi:hypothetical protein